MKKRVTITDKDEIVHAQWEGDEVPLSVADLPNESATHPYILRVEHVMEAGDCVWCQARKVLGGGRE